MSKSKLLTAIAVAALVATSAFAQSNVTVYGTADAGLVQSTSDRTDSVNRKNGVQGGLLQKNKLGFRGTEDLGNGLKAIFQIETGYDIAQNGGLNTNRESFIGLSSSTLGTVKLGRLETLDSRAAAHFDALGASAFSPLGTVLGRETFANSTVDYSNQLGALSVGAQYSSDGSTANANTAFGAGTKQERSAGLMAVYSLGMADVGYVYNKAVNYGRVDGDDRSTHVLGGTVDLVAAKVYGAYANAKSDLANTLNLRVASVGVKVPVTGKTHVDAAYARVKDVVTDGRANVYGAQVIHNLSKRTAAYAGYQYVSNENTQYAALNTNGVAVQGGTGLNSSGYGVGLRHNF